MTHFRSIGGAIFLLGVLLVFPAIARKVSSASNPDNSECYLWIDIYGEPEGAHVYFDWSGAEWGAPTNTKPISWWISCTREQFNAKKCEFSFTAKKSGYTDAHHTLRITHCAYNSKNEAKVGQHVKFTMVLNPH